MMRSTFVTAILLSGIVIQVSSHGTPLSDTPGPDVDWATKHMAEEHHITTFTPESFFALHDFNSDGLWSPAEILRTYGLSPSSSVPSTDVPPEHNTDLYRNEITSKLLQLIDVDRRGTITRDEFVRYWKGSNGKPLDAKAKGSGGWLSGGEKKPDGLEENGLPDFGTGPGHHGDVEYEYEIHHFEKFHDENTKEEDLTHPEDIEHFKHHEEEEVAAMKSEKEQQQTVVEANIPAKYKK